jgi:hypothetical protein
MPNLEKPIADYIQNRIFYSEKNRLEFYDRLENLCERRFPMSEDLKSNLNSYLEDNQTSLEFIRVVEAFPQLEKPVLPQDVLSRFEAKLPTELYLPFLRIFDRSCCPEITPETFGYTPTTWDFGVALYITSTIPSGYSAYFEFTSDQGTNWLDYGILTDNQLVGTDPIYTSLTDFWSRLRVVSGANCTYYSEVSTVTS